MNTSTETTFNEAPTDEPNPPSPRILVVDDDQGVRKLNVIALSNSGYKVDSAEDGESAWEALQANHYDLLITDNNMPEVSGAELIRKVRSVQTTPPIILASGSMTLEALAERRLPAVTMLPKPYGMSELLEVVKNVLPAVPKMDAREKETLHVERYTKDRKKEWDEFVSQAKNATFLFYRDYMDYHSDRFLDQSLMIFCDETLVGLLPANLTADGTLISHEGLTYGGLVVSRTATMKEVLSYFHEILEFLYRNGIFKLRYKQIPDFYNTLPDDEVAYALFLLDARLYRRDCAAAVSQADRLPLRRSRKNLVKKAVSEGVRIVQETSFQPFWNKVLIPQLAERYGVKPVHTLDEITLLASRFPGQIKQFSAYCGDEIVAGTTIYETPVVAHAQYGAVTEKGRQSGAQALLFSSLIEQYQDKRFFDFGISNENGGRSLNHGLLDWKEGFGARSFAHDFYEITTGSYTRLEPVLQSQAETGLTLPAETLPSPAVPNRPLEHKYFAHAQALVDEGAVIGRSTRVWAFAHVVNGAVIGEDCNICDHTFIEGGVRVGNRVTIKCGVFLWKGLTVEDGVFIGPGAVFTNDYRPRSKKYLKQHLVTVLAEGCTLGAHSTTLPGVRIGRWAMVGAGSVVTRDVPDHALVVGAPARFRAWVCRCGEKLSSDSGSLLACPCGRYYEQISADKIIETNLFSPANAGVTSR